MLLTRIYEDGLAQAAYLIADEHAGVGMVVDANRDVERYVEAAARERIRIAAVTETHIHADFLSGSRELARRLGVPLYVSAEGGRDWQYAFGAADGVRLLRHGERLELGALRIEARHTP